MVLQIPQSVLAEDTVAFAAKRCGIYTHKLYISSADTLIAGYLPVE